jgi:integrase
MSNEWIHIDGEGSIETLERGRRYRIRFRLPLEVSGRRKWSRSVTVKGTKADARIELENLRKELEEELNNKSGTVLISEYALNFHQTRKDMNTLSPLSIKRDDIEIERIIENFGEIAIDKLTTEQISDVYARLRRSGMSKSSLHKLHQKLNQILNMALASELIIRNPCVGITNVHRPSPKERKCLTDEQAAQLARDLKQSERNGRIVAVWIALATGVRRGEALGLIWKYVDLDKCTIRIEQQLDSNGEIRSPKSAMSKRTITIDAGTVVFLREWKDMQSKDYFGGQTVPDDFPVCSNAQTGKGKNNFISTSCFDKWRREYFVKHGLGHYKKEEKWIDSRGIERVRRSGYEGFNFHELRHTQATLLIGSGADYKTVQTRLGHSSASLTMNIYAHPVRENDREAADFIGGVMNK